MWGVQFRKANNSLICGSAEFEVRYRNKQSEVYRISFGPHDGMTIMMVTDDGWKIVKHRIVL